eukprot:scaffold103723_cov63-Phaeocystis_antarctica.AAC.6
MPTLPHLICAWMREAMKKTPRPPQHSSERARPVSPMETSPARGLKGARKTGLSLLRVTRRRLGGGDGDGGGAGWAKARRCFL